MYGMQRFRQRRRFGGATGRRFGYAKPGLLTVNHCEIASFTTVAGVENQQAIFDAQEAPGNRNTDIPVGSVLKKVLIKLWGSDATPVNGYHRCMMFHQKGAGLFATPIASWLSGADPLTEEDIQVRQAAMGRVGRQLQQIVTVTGVTGPPRHTCFWKGNITMRDGDDIVVVVQDQAATNWIGLCYAWYVT